MKNFKRVLALLLAVVITMSSFATISAQAKKIKYMVSAESQLGVNCKTKLCILRKDTYNTVKLSNFTFKSTKPSVATISKKGVITGKKLGKTTINVYKNKKLVCKKTFTVRTAYIDKGGTITGNSPYIDLQDEYYPYSYMYHINPKAKYSFIISDEDKEKVVIDENGSIKAKYNEADTITIKCVEKYKGKSVTFGTVKLEIVPVELRGDTLYMSAEDNYYISDPLGFFLTLINPTKCELVYSMTPLTKEQVEARAKAKDFYCDIVRPYEGEIDPDDYSDYLDEDGNLVLCTFKGGECYVYYCPYNYVTGETDYAAFSCKVSITEEEHDDWDDDYDDDDYDDDDYDEDNDWSDDED